MRTKGSGKGRTKGKERTGEQRRPQPQGKDLLFILDIGTRSVIGVAGRLREEMLEVLCVDWAEHSERAVVDGQIEDIEQTARVAGQVKSRMEKKLGVTLGEVHVAAAGRVLKTERACCEMEVDENHPIAEKELAALEAMAVQRAYEELAAGLAEGEPADFSSVGHTVVGYQLDGYRYSTLSGHRGKKAGIEIIATFLPTEVVESLYTTMSMLGLNIASMTLEPIAAMNAVVPRELRLLNIALVDVGAGTSDIAVADKGSICGYTMATVAGDEVTERVMQEFLVDFGTAERMKFALSAGEEVIEYHDVLGFPYSVSGEELAERVRTTIEDLARQIADGILSINQTPPKAVFMVGGGSRTPGLCRLVAAALGIEENKVAIGGNNYMKRQIIADPQYLSAEYATPIGIAVTAMTAGNGENFAVSLNGSRLQLLGRAMTVLEALRRSGYQYGQIMGRSGKNVVFELNGERQIARGGLPTLAEIRVGGTLAGLSTPLQAGDEISFVPAADGEDAAPVVRDWAECWEPFEVELFGQTAAAGTRAWINDRPAGPDQPIRQMDRVVIRQVNTMGALLESMGFGGQEGEVTLNGAPCTGPEQTLHPGDRVALRQGQTPPAPGSGEEEPPAEEPPPAPVTPEKQAEENGAPEDRTEPQEDWPEDPPEDREDWAEEPEAETPPEAPPPPEPRRPPGRSIRVVLNGRERLLPPKEDGSSYQFFDLLNYVDMDTREAKGRPVLLRNGSTAAYLDPISEGDQAEIRWSEEEPE